jgi:hypothetical protein
MTDAFASVLARLVRLSEIDLDGWSTAKLPALAHCTQLTALHGQWVEAPAAAAAAATRRRAPGNTATAECPSVRAIAAMGCVPFAAFKHVESIKHWEPWQPAVFSSIAQHCQQLRTLQLAPLGDADSTASMPAAAPAEQRTSAIRSLCGLQHLRQLYFSINDSAEAAALAALTQLTQLGLRVPADSSCDLIGLMHLVALRRLQELLLDPRGLLVCSVDAKALIVALQFIPRVEVTCTNGSSNWACFGAAQDALKSSGVLIPQQLELREPCDAEHWQ